MNMTISDSQYCARNGSDLSAVEDSESDHEPLSILQSQKNMTLARGYWIAGSVHIEYIHSQSNRKNVAYL